MLASYTMVLSNGYNYTFVADGREEAVVLANEHLALLRQRNDPAAKTENNRFVRTVKSIRIVKSVYEGARTFTIAGAVHREEDDSVVGTWHVRVAQPSQAAEVFKEYARALGGIPVLAGLFKGKLTPLSLELQNADAAK